MGKELRDKKEGALKKRETGLDGLSGSQRAGLKLFLQPVGSRRRSFMFFIILYNVEMSEAVMK